MFKVLAKNTFSVDAFLFTSMYDYSKFAKFKSTDEIYSVSVFGIGIGTTESVYRIPSTGLPNR